MITPDKFSLKDLEQISTYITQVDAIKKDIPRNDRTFVNDAYDFVIRVLGETADIIKITLDKEKGIHRKISDVFYPLHIRNLIDAKSNIDEMYRHINTAYKGQHIEKIIQIKLNMTRFIRIFSIAMNEKVNNEQRTKGKRKGTQLIGRRNPRKDKKNKNKVSSTSKRTGEPNSKRQKGKRER